MNSLTICSASLLLSGSALAQAYIPIPGGAYQGNDITPDGEIVVGSGNNGGFYWRRSIDPLPTDIGGQTAIAVSDDGSVIAGYMQHPVTGDTVAGRWTQSTGWLPLDVEHPSAVCSGSSAWDMNADGTVVVGGAWLNGCEAWSFYWELGQGVTYLEYLGNGSNRPRAVSADGSTVVGFAQGNFTRTLARWDATTGTGAVPDMDEAGEYKGVSADGRFLLGGRNNSAFFEELDPVLGTFVATQLGGLNPGWEPFAVAISESGGTIAGMDVLGLGKEAWVWNAQTGIVSLRQRLTNLGVGGVPSLGEVNAMTPDGRFIVGDTAFGDAWVVEIPPGPGILPYGCGLQNPPESLVHVSGTASIGASFELGVDDPTGVTTAPALGVVSFSISPMANYPCGLPIPGWGMIGASGDLLISVGGGNPFMQLISPSLWATPGTTANVTFFVPFDTNLFGLEMYAQGALFSPSISKIGLTNAMRIGFGMN